MLLRPPCGTRWQLRCVGVKCAARQGPLVTAGAPPAAAIRGRSVRTFGGPRGRGAVDASPTNLGVLHEIPPSKLPGHRPLPRECDSGRGGAGAVVDGRADSVSS